jgi:hypothetical protein
MVTWIGDEPPAGEGRTADRATPAGSDAQRAAQRDTWRKMQASYRAGKRGDRRRRTAARGTLPARPGMHRRMPPGGDDAA